MTRMYNKKSTALPYAPGSIKRGKAQENDSEDYDDNENENDNEDENDNEADSDPEYDSLIKVIAPAPPLMIFVATMHSSYHCFSLNKKLILITN